VQKEKQLKFLFLLNYYVRTMSVLKGFFGNLSFLFETPTAVFIHLASSQNQTMKIDTPVPEVSVGAGAPVAVYIQLY
jgi:hypothetical protein